jgi:hypothetical protein
MQQVRVPVKHLDQLDQGQRRLCLSGLIAGKGINPAAAFTCRLKSSISRMTRSDSTASRTDSAQAGQKSPVTAGMTVLSPLCRRRANHGCHESAPLCRTMDISCSQLLERYFNLFG